MKNIFRTLLLLIPFGSLQAQVSTTEIFLVDIIKKDKKVTYGKPVNITNREGYDNQPEFSPDGKKLFYVSMPDTTQSELYEFVIADSTTNRLTETPESEFSPRYAPDGKTTTMVRVDADKTQRFYQFTDSPEDLYDLANGIDSVGYYCWINDSIVGLAVLNNGMELYIYEVRNSQFIVLEKNVGRCLMALNSGNNLIYTRQSGDAVTLMNYDLTQGESNFYAEGMKGVTDYALAPDGKIYCGSEGKLYLMDPNGDKKWNEVADFSKTIGNFYRLTASRDGKRLAMVGYKGKRP
ncbi:MAG: PD40 domain-containing protein [Bacteroidia bacterium]|nr:PD40 domain-containing protein [Bacteroidota bacterium]MBK8874043.1 PD40 domain-containing protein [Bacteroidota bacterium]MBP9082091.1 PD40 domain-containing protein [Bacteroidia bacterium]